MGTPPPYLTDHSDQSPALLSNTWSSAWDHMEPAALRSCTGRNWQIDLDKLIALASSSITTKGVELDPGTWPPLGHGGTRLVIMPRTYGQQGSYLDVAISGCS